MSQKAFYFSLILLFLSISSTANSKNRFSMKSYDSCYFAWVSKELDAKAMTCFNNFEKGKGFINFYYSNKTTGSGPTLCSQKTRYKMEKGDLKIKALRGNCANRRSAWPGEMVCSFETEKLLLCRFDEKELRFVRIDEENI